MTPITPGRVLNCKWTVGAPLGVADSGTIYEAFHRNGIRAAVMILRPDLANDVDCVARFVRDGAAANQLEHVGAVVAFDDDRTEDGLVYMVYERLEGETLSTILDARAPLPPVEALRITDRLLDALVTAHGRGVLHLTVHSIEPANVLLLPDGSVRFLDLGRTSSERPSVDDRPVARTANNTILGTPPPGRPEPSPREEGHLIEDHRGPASVAAALFRMLTGTPLPTPRAPIRDVLPTIPVVVARVVDRGLSDPPGEPITTVLRMKDAVREALDDLTTLDAATTAAVSTERESIAFDPVSLAAAGIPQRSARRARSYMLLALILIGSVALAGISWLASAAMPEPRRGEMPNGSLTR